VAAIEFAVVFSVLFLGIYGLISFGGVLYAQQIVSRAAEEGARAVQLARSGISSDDLQQNAITAVYQSLALSMIAPASVGTAPESKEIWLRSKMATTPPSVNLSAGEVAVTVTYPYSANPLLPALPFSSGWMPDHLFGKATVARPSS